MFKNVRYVTTVLTPAKATAPAGAYDLTDLATVKTELGITDTNSDTFLSAAITQESAAIASYCNRVFAVEGVQDVIYLEREMDYRKPRLEDLPIQLSRWPVVPSQAPLTVTGNTTNGSAAITGIASTSGLFQGLPASAAGIPSGATILSVDSASQVTLSAAATATATGVAITTGTGVLQTIVPGVPTALVQGVDYVIDPTRGWLMPPSPYAASALRYLPFWVEITVNYSAGFTTVPADLAMAALRLVTTRFRAKGRDPLIKMERDGGTSHGSEVEYWIPNHGTALPPEITSICDRYRAPVLA